MLKNRKTHPPDPEVGAEVAPDGADDSVSEPCVEGEAGQVAGDAAFDTDFMQAVLGGLDKENRLLEADKEQVEERLVRLQADFDNYRRRTEREKESLGVFATESLMKSLLPVLDNLDRAIASAVATDEGPLMSGVLLVRKQFADALARAGLCEVEAVGAVFDPNLHEAMGHVAVDGACDDTVADEFQKGYMLGGRLIRASMVRVVRNPQ